MNAELVAGYVLVPLFIFLIRIADVSMGTMRIIFVSRGIRYWAAILGFFEVLIWLVAIVQIMRNLDSPLHYIAYAGGFAMGNFVGITLERKLSMGSRVVRVVTGKDASELVRVLREKGYGVTSIDAEGANGPVKLIFSVVRRGHAPELIEIIKKFNPRAFFTVEDIRFVNENNLFPAPGARTAALDRFGSLVAKKK